MLAILALSGCRPEKEKKREAADRTVHIRVRNVTFHEYRMSVRATGLLGTRTEMKLSFKTGGIVKQVNVREGESVKGGKILAVLDLSEIGARADQAEIALEKARRDLTRAENLYHDSVATLEQYENALSAYELARTRKRIADFNLQHSRIRAPSDGKIQKILVETSEMIAPGHPAILFASTENDWVVRVALTDRDIVKLALGDSARVHMDPFPGMGFEAVVTELGSIADPVTGTFEAELLIPRALPQFRTGFVARVQIYPDGRERSLTIPVEALLEADDHTAYVYTYEAGKVDRKRVKTGLILDDAVVVLEGLEEGDRVVTEGASYLSRDSKVHLVDHPESSRQ